VEENTHADSELLSRIAKGDRGVLSVLYDRYAESLYPIAVRVLRDRSEAEDVLHDAFVTLAERAAQYSESRGTVVAWLVALVRNLSIDRARRRDRRGTIDRDVVAHEPPPSVRTPERSFVEASERQKMQRAMASLAEPQRKTLESAFFEGLSYPEMAEREGVPLGTIKSRAARALAALREALEREGVSLDPTKLTARGEP
jgi:RNA polymerase sigma-70 factor (ECF subfamily)